MNFEIVEKKIEQIKVLLKEIEGLLSKPFSLDGFGMIIIRAAERDFQLIVDTASDINTIILGDKTGKIPETYRESFSHLADIKIFPETVLQRLIQGARLRNVLVHDYDFDEDFKRFYDSAKVLVPFFNEYVKGIIKYINNK